MDSLKIQVQEISTGQEGDIGRLSETIDSATKNIDEMTEAITAHGDRLAIVEGALRVVLERLTSVEHHVQQLTDGIVGGDEIGSAAAAVPSKLFAVKKNALQGVVRVCLKAFMEITDSEALPKPLVNGQFWEATTITDPRSGEVVPSRCLRPRWDRPWGENESAWLLDVIHRIKQSGHKYTDHNFEVVTHEQMKKAVESVWKTFIKRWAGQNTTQVKKDEKSALNKKNQRKVVVRAMTCRYEQACLPWLAILQITEGD
ncbi:hypothetical protein C2E23DRAFT_743845 [Lenzites betulinus]|nr:hypothetical protein C2E23DRAFT_743845 [Lenzites betulinus]